MRAARALKEANGVAKGAHLHLEKRLPVASGIGGGSQRRRSRPSWIVPFVADFTAIGGPFSIGPLIRRGCARVFGGPGLHHVRYR